MWTRWRQFFSEGLWNFRLEDAPKGKKLFYRWLRISALSVRSFFADQCILYASSLTYYLLMSIVPLLTIAFAVARGFGYQQYLRGEILEKFQDQKTALFEIIAFAEKLLEETRGGLIAGIGVAVLFWSAVQLLSNIEDAFNHIWDVRKKRSWRHLLSEYFSLLFIAPLIFILSNSATVFIVRYAEGWIHLLPLHSKAIALLLFLLHLLPYGFFWLLFSFLYYFLPNYKVRAVSAFTGGIVAGTLYLVVQWGYIYFQIGVSRYGAVYGSFAALPLFLIWVQVSWFLLLFGAEVSHAHQTVDEHEFGPAVHSSSPGLRKMVMLWIMQLAIQRFKERKIPLTLGWLIGTCKIPAALAQPLIEQLVATNLLIEVKGSEKAYLPGRAYEHLRIADVLQALDEQGTSSADMPFLCAKQLAAFEQAFRVFAEIVQTSSQNYLLSELDCDLLL